MGGGSCLSKHKRDKCEDLPCQCEQCYRALYPGDSWGQHHGRKHSKRHKHDHQQTYAMTWTNGSSYGASPYGISPYGGPVQMQFGYPMTSDYGCMEPMTTGWADDCGCDACSSYVASPCGCDACGGEVHAGMVAVHGQHFAFSEASCAVPQMVAAGPTCSAPVAPSCSAPAPASCAMPGVMTPTPDCASQQMMIPGNPYEQSFPAAVPPVDTPGQESEKIPLPPQEKPVEQNFQAPPVNAPAEQPVPASDPIQQTSWNTLQVPPSPFPPVPNINFQQGNRLMIRKNLSMPTR